MTQLTVEHAVLRHLLALAASDNAGETVREIAAYEVAQLKVWLEAKTDPKLPMAYTAHWSSALEEINDFTKNPQKYAAPAEPAVPPGQPIGDDAD
jgi:hypothetical protein